MRRRPPQLRGLTPRMVYLRRFDFGRLAVFGWRLAEPYKRQKVL